jgi:hypothetical protein
MAAPPVANKSAARSTDARAFEVEYVKAAGSSHVRSPLKTPGALLSLADEEANADRVRRYIEAYQEKPESRTEIAAATRVARRVLRAIAWDGERREAGRGVAGAGR